MGADDDRSERPVGTSGEGERLRGLHSVDASALPSLFDTVLDQSSTGVMVFDAELRMADVNQMAARFGGDPADAHVGKRLSELYPQIAVQIDPLIAQVLDGGEPIPGQELVWESPHPPHERRFWMVSYVPIRSTAETDYISAFYVAHKTVARPPAQHRQTKLQ